MGGKYLVYLDSPGVVWPERRREDSPSPTVTPETPSPSPSPGPFAPCPRLALPFGGVAQAAQAFATSPIHVQIK